MNVYIYIYTHIFFFYSIGCIVVKKKTLIFYIKKLFGWEKKEKNQIYY